MANGELFSLSASITLDTSEYERGIRDAEEAGERLGDSIRDDLGDASDETRESVEGLGDEVGRGLPSQMESGGQAVMGFAEILKAHLVEGAISVAIQGIQSLIGAIANLTTGAVSGFAQYEQLVGGVETIFGDAADTIIENADRAFTTAGMSANEYLQNTITLSVPLINGIKEKFLKLSEEELAIKTAELEQIFEAQKQGLSDEYELTEKTYNEEYTALKRSLDKSLEARKRYFDDVYDDLSAALDREIEAQQRANSKALEAAQRSYEANVEAYQKATDARIKEIDREYLENIKLIDEERYRKLKAIDDQIDALNGLSEAERKRREKSERAERLSQLQQAYDEAETYEEREEARKNLERYKAEIAQKEREEERKNQIDSLKNEKDRINEEADAKKTAAQKARDEKVAAVQEESKAILKAMQEQYQAEVSALREAQAEQIASMRESKATRLKELKRSQDDELTSIKEANADQLAQEKDSQKKALEALKEYNKERLTELEDNLEQEKAILANGRSEQELTAEEWAEIYEQAAALVDKVMVGMSDNVNKMGTDAGMVRNAIMGVVRGNYTMLENLGIGVAGTTEGMQGVIDKVNELNGLDLDIGNPADRIDALLLYQDELKITGTTAEEATSTISGSWAQLQGAWSNLVDGLGKDNADIDKLVDDVVNSAETLWTLLEPRLEKIFDGILKFFDEMIPSIKEKVPGLIEEATPVVIEFIEGLGETIGPELPGLAKDIFDSLVDAINEEAPAAIPLVTAALSVPILSGIASIGTTIGGFFSGILGTGGAVAAGAGGAAIGGGVAAVAGGAVLGAGAVVGVKTAMDANKEYAEAAEARKNETEIILDGYKEVLSRKGKEAADAYANSVMGIDTTNLDIQESMKAITAAIEKEWEGVPKNIWDGFKQTYDEYLGGSGSQGPVQLFEDSFGAALDAVLDIFGIASPSKEFKKIAKNNMEGFKKGTEDKSPEVIEIMTDVGTKAMEGFEKGFVERSQSVMQTVKIIAENITEAFGEISNIHSPSTVFEENAEILANASAEYKTVAETHKNETETILNGYKEIFETKGKEAADAYAKAVMDIDTTNMSLEESLKAMSEKIEKEWDSVPQNLWEGFLDGVKHYFGMDGIHVGELMGDVFGAGLDAVYKVFDINSPSKEFKKISKHNFEGFEEGAKEEIPGMVELMANAGVMAMEGFEKGFVERAASVIKTVELVAQNIVTVFKNTLQIHSPSRVFEDLAEMVPEGISLGIENGIPGVLDTVKGMGSSMTDAMTSFEDGMTGFIGGGMQFRTGTSSPFITTSSTAGGNSNKNVTVVLKIGEYEMGRTVFELYNKQAQLHGMQIARG